MSININLDNYEAYLLDWSEGNLSEKEEQALRDFLVLHPEIDGEGIDTGIKLNPAPSLHISPDGLQFEQPTPANRTYFFTAAVENELSAKAQDQLAQFLKKHPEFQQEFEQFQKSKLTAPSILYPNKNELLAIATPSFSLAHQLYVWSLRAAMFTLLFGTSYLFFLNRSTEGMLELPLARLEVETIEPAKTAESENIKPLEQQSTIALRQENKTASEPIHSVKLDHPKSTTEKTTEQIETNTLLEQIGAPRMAPQLEQITLALRPIETPKIEPLPYPVNTTDAISFKDFAFQSISNKLPAGLPKEKPTKIVDAINMGLRMVSDEKQYVAKEENNRVKTSISIGSFQFERSVSK